MPEAVGPDIFISYRRQEDRHVAGRLYDNLVNRLGAGRVFFDVASIQPGADFADAINRAMTTCKVLLAIIGPHWLTARNEQGRRRLENPDDSVRQEIEAAFGRQVPVIPILVEDAVMPSRQDLPDSLRRLAFRQGFVVRHENFPYDIDRLIPSVEASVHLRSQTQQAQGSESNDIGDYAAGPFDVPGNIRSDVRWYPVLGRLAAGPGMLPEGDREFLPLQPPAPYTHRDDIFAVRVIGDSMTGDGVLDGDYVIVIQDREPSDGEMVIVYSEEEAIIKRFWREDTAIRLESSNADFPSMIVGPDDDVVVVGKVIGVVRWNINKVRPQA